MKETVYKVMKKYYLEGQVTVTITNQSRKSCNTMAESEIIDMYGSWLEEGCHIVNGTNEDWFDLYWENKEGE